MATKEEIARIKDFVGRGLSYKEIAQELGWTNKTADRSVMRIVKKLRNEENESIVKNALEDVRFENMTRGQRLTYLKNTFLHTPRARMALQALEPQEVEFFQDEYLKLHASLESVNEAEDQQLFSACLEYALAYRYLHLDRIEQRLYSETMSGKWKKDVNPEYRGHYNNSFQKLYERHFKTYQELTKSLKVTREQRLKDIRDDKQNLLEVATEFASNEVQVTMAEEIHRLSKKTDEELKRLIEKGFLFGDFEN